MTKKEVDIPIVRCTQYYWLGLFFNQVLPSSIGGDAIRGYCLVREGNSLGRATSVVVLDRMMGMIGLALLIVITLPMALSFINTPTLQWGIGLSLLAVIAGLVTALFMDFFLRGFASWCVTTGLMAFATDARRLLLSRIGVALALHSAAIHVISVVAVGMLSRALNMEVSWLALAVIVPIMTLLATVPISIAGWGVREGFMVVGLGYAGIGAEQALALSILYGLSLLVVALPGGVAWIMAPAVRALGRRQASVREI